MSLVRIICESVNLNCSRLIMEIVSANESTVLLFAADEEREIAVPFGKIKSGSLVFRGFEPQAPKKKKGGGKAGPGGKRRRTDEESGRHREEDV